VISASPDAIDWAFQRSTTVYFLTNTRSMGAAEAERVVDEMLDAAAESARRLGGTVEYISRGDSTLRGHFPLEVNRILERTARDIHGCLLVPAFPAAGRLTIDGVHTVNIDGRQIPVGESEYARDATFGYDVSGLVEWARERVPATWRVVEIASATFDQGIDALVDALTLNSDFTVFCPSIRDDSDLDLLARAHRELLVRDRSLIVQAGPAYPAFYGNLSRANEIDFALAPGNGLVVAGSHTNTTTQQLESVAATGAVAHCELHIDELFDGDRAREIDRIVDCVEGSLAAAHVIVSTTRTARVSGDSATSLAIARSIADAVTDVTRRVLHRGVPFVVAKGGITSHDVLANGLGWDAALVLGPLLEGTLPVMRNWRECADTSTAAIIFPGNVGDSGLLSRAIARLTMLANRTVEGNRIHG